MSVPVFNQHPAFNSGNTTNLNNSSTAPAYSEYASQFAPERNEFSGGPVRETAGVMTIDSVIMKTGFTIALTVLGAVVGWFFPGLAIPAAIAGFILGLVNSFKREPSPALILSYGAIQGVAVGGISAILEAAYPGVAIQALIATGSIFAVVLAAYSMRLVRATPKLTRIFLFAMFAYVGYSLINLGLVMFGAIDTPFGLGTVEVFGIPLGLLTGALAVLLGCYSLVTDFDFVEQGVNSGAPERYSWTAAFGLVLTIVWLYVELLRIIAIARGNN